MNRSTEDMLSVSTQLDFPVDSWSWIYFIAIATFDSIMAV